MIAFRRDFTERPVKEAFHRYLTDFDAVENDGELLAQLAQCDDLLPPRYAALLFLPPASTYRDAVRVLLSTWTYSDAGGGGSGNGFLRWLDD